jgi:hypothetical protein
LSEMQDQVWESSDAVRLSIVLPRELVQRLADEAGRRDVTSRDLAEQLIRLGLADLNENDAPGG